MQHKISKCPIDKNGHSGCHPACSITNGFGGAGAYSDGKFNITSEFGGWMTEYLEPKIVEELISYVDSINLKYGAPTAITDPTTDKVREIERRGYAVGLKLLRAKVRHLGTENNLKIMARIYDDLAKWIDMRYETEVTDVIIEDDQVKGIKIKDELIECNQVFWQLEEMELPGYKPFVKLTELV